MSAARAGEIASFLAGAGWDGACRRSLTGDASFRRYERLARGAATAILMDAPPPENVRPFLAVAELLRQAGFAVPAIRAADDSSLARLLVSLPIDSNPIVARTEKLTTPIATTVSTSENPEDFCLWGRFLT